MRDGGGGGESAHDGTRAVTARSPRARHAPFRASVVESLCSEHFLKTCEARGGSDGQSRSRIGASRSECDDQTRLDARVASVAWEAPVPKPLTRRHISKIDETTWDTSGLDATRRGLGPAWRRRVVGSSSRVAESDRENCAHGWLGFRGRCAHLHDGLGGAARRAGAHADVRGGGGGDVERHGGRVVGAQSN